jgi:hypothetical protein
MVTWAELYLRSVADDTTPFSPYDPTLGLALRQYSRLCSMPHYRCSCLATVSTMSALLALPLLCTLRRLNIVPTSV